MSQQAQVRDAANSHPTKPGFVVVNDPVHCFGRGGTRIEYEHRTVAVDQVFRFIDARS
jgi:hypothetical protein